MFKISNVIPLEDIYEREAIIFMKKYQKEEAPDAFYDLIGNFISPEDSRKKQKHSIKIPSAFKPGQALYQISHAWNNCNPTLREPSMSIQAAKNKISEAIRKRLDAKNCPNKNCYMCNRDQHIDFEKYAGK